MTPTRPRHTLPAGQWLLLRNVDWPTYGRFLRLFAKRPGTKLTYDRGRLEIMAPLLSHDDDAHFVGLLIFVLIEELGLPMKGSGSVTIRRRDRKRGLEPDRCYWIANAQRMAGRRRLDLSID